MTGRHQAEPLTPDWALQIFKMYDDKGWAVKQQVIAIVVWLTPFVFGLIAYAVRDYISDSASTTATVAGWTAFLLSVFMTILVLISLWHANADYVRSHRVIEHARHIHVLPREIFGIIQDEPKKGRILHCLRMQYIGWQFIVIMCFALLLAGASLWVIACLPSLRSCTRAISGGAA